MKARFEQFKEKYACLGDARGVGLAWGLEIIDTADVKTKTPDADTTKAIIRSAWERGLLLIAPVGHYGNVLRLAPPLVITAEELNQALDILDEVFTLHNGGGAPSDTIETDEDTTD
jgi:4-aminobutyrate aminotransferase-like enzyme